MKTSKSSIARRWAVAAGVAAIASCIPLVESAIETKQKLEKLCSDERLIYARIHQIEDKTRQEAMAVLTVPQKKKLESRLAGCEKGWQTCKSDFNRRHHSEMDTRSEIIDFENKHLWPVITDSAQDHANNLLFAPFLVPLGKEAMECPTQQIACIQQVRKDIGLER